MKAYLGCGLRTLSSFLLLVSLDTLSFDAFGLLIILFIRTKQVDVFIIIGCGGGGGRSGSFRLSKDFTSGRRTREGIMFCAVRGYVGVPTGGVGVFSGGRSSTDCLEDMDIGLRRGVTTG